MKYAGLALVGTSLVVAVIDAATLAAWGTIIVAVSGLAGVILLGIQNAYVAKAAVRRADDQAREAAEERAALRLQQAADKADLALTLLEAAHKIDAVKGTADTISHHVNSTASKLAEKIEALLTKVDAVTVDNQRLRKELADERQASALAAQAAIAAAARAASEAVAKTSATAALPQTEHAHESLQSIDGHVEKIEQNTAATKSDVEELKDK